MTTLAQLRTTHSVVSAEATSIGGWLTWTAMKMAPAATAAAPAARVRAEEVMVMSSSLVVLVGCRTRCAAVP